MLQCRAVTCAARPLPGLASSLRSKLVCAREQSLGLWKNCKQQRTFQTAVLCQVRLKCLDAGRCSWNRMHECYYLPYAGHSFIFVAFSNPERTLCGHLLLLKRMLMFVQQSISGSERTMSCRHAWSMYEKNTQCHVCTMLRLALRGTSASHKV